MLHQEADEGDRRQPGNFKLFAIVQNRLATILWLGIHEQRLAVVKRIRQLSHLIDTPLDGSFTQQQVLINLAGLERLCP